MAVNPGAKAELHAQGVNFDTGQTIALDVPRDVPTGPWLASLPTAQGPTLPVPLVVTTLPVATESGDAPAGPEDGQALAMPVAISGVLGEPNDVDGYRFEAKKGQVFAFEVVARRAGSTADPVLQVVDDKGASLAEADDSPGTKDPRLEWTAPADGAFVVQVSDLHSRGGDDFGYVLEAEAATPDFVLTCDPDKLNLGPGARVPIFAQVEPPRRVRRAGDDRAGRPPPGRDGQPPDDPARDDPGGRRRDRRPRRQARRGPPDDPRPGAGRRTRARPPGRAEAGDLPPRRRARHVPREHPGAWP